MIKHLSVCLVAMTCFVMVGSAQDAAAGKNHYVTCVACHMTEGQGNLALNSPAIAGQEDWYVVRQLKNYKEGIRGKDPKDIYGMQMQPMTMVLPDDKAIADVAAYISAMKPAPRGEPTIKGNVEKGKQLYAICATCHGPDGKGMKAMNSPNLTLQQDWYVKRQIENFKNGIRGKNPKDIFGMQMTPMVATLTSEQDINDVVAYIMTLE